MDRLQWHFEKATPNTPQTNPQLGDHFNRDETKNLVSAIIRESVQNALDARLSADTPVHVSFTMGFVARNSLGANRSMLFDNFDHHFNASFPGRKPPNDQLHYWAIEDENTSGLTGDIQTHFEPEKEEYRKEERLFFFWKTDGGITNKGGVSKTLGTRGIGKAIFNFSTPLRSFWATSRRATEKDDVLIGRAVLKQHKIDGVTYLFRGLFGLAGKTPDGEPCILPSQDEQDIRSFHEAFSLKRQAESSGTSIVIPFNEPIPGADLALLKDRIIEEFGLAVVQGKLTFALSTPEGEVHLNKSNIQPLADEMANDELSKLIQLYTEIEAKRHGATRLIPVKNKRPKDYIDTLLDFPKLEQLRKDYAEHNLVIVTVPFPLTTTKLQEDSEWTLALQLTDHRDSTVLNRFNRSGLDITDEPYRKVRDAHALVFPDDSELTAILSSSENAAHTKFERGIENFSDYKNQYGWIISFARNLARNIHDLLAPQASNVDTTLLAQFFPFEPSAGRGPRPTPGPDPRPTPPSVPPVPTTPQKFVLSKVTTKGQCGVKVTNSELLLEPGEKIKCQFAYSMRGRSFGKHSESDFTLQSNTRGIPFIQLKREGTKMPSYDGDNTVIIAVNDPTEWSLIFTGFDRHRALDVRITVEND